MELRGAHWLGGSQASWAGVARGCEGRPRMVSVTGMQLWTRGGAGPGRRLWAAQGRTRLAAPHSRGSACPESPPPVSRSPSQSGQRGLWPVKSCTLCQHVSQPSHPAEPPRRRVPINSPAWPSPASGAREAHRQRRARSRQPQAPAQGQGRSTGPAVAPQGCPLHPLDHGRPAMSPGPQEADKLVKGAGPGPCRGNEVGLGNPEAGGRARHSRPWVSRALRPSPRLPPQGALRTRWGWPLQST